MKNSVQLITYADRFAGDLFGLTRLLRGQLHGLFGGVHILPFFYPIDGADAGFDPIDHTKVDSRLGGWIDIRDLATDHELVADVIVNHISRDSPQFQDFIELGSRSGFTGLFLTRDSVFPGGPTEAELRAIYRPRPGPPFSRVQLKTGELLEMWTTFTAHQIDIDVYHPQGHAYLDRILDTFGDNGIRMIRIDAVGYAIKKRGTSCFMIPGTYDFIADFTQRARQRGLEVLVEIHSYYRQQIEIAARVDWVYDFALPPLLLHAFMYRTARSLKEWIGIRPINALTVLDTHDGIGIVDIGANPADRAGQPGLVSPAELDGMVEQIHANSGGVSRKATGAAASNLDLYQVNCTYYDALARDDLRYLLARAVQFFLPGIPQVYYVGLLAGTNDADLLARTGVGRDINRAYYNEAAVDTEIRRPVVRRLFDLIRMRNMHRAFGGHFELLESASTALNLRWTQAGEMASLFVDFASLEYRIEFSGSDKPFSLDAA
jgi:sucrose phosphorylase